MAIVTYQKHIKDFNVHLQNIKKLVIYNNPNTPVTIIHDNTTSFEINNSLTVECFGECFDYSFEAQNVSNVTLEIWK